MSEQQLEARVWEVYSCLYKPYRQGDFELDLDCYQYEWPELNDTADFYAYLPPEEDVRFTTKKIKYTEAVENLYQLILFLGRNMEGWVKEHEVLMLKIKNLVYEVKDYSLAVPPELGKFFLDQAREFNENVKRNEVERFADEIRREESDLQEPDDERARVIKMQIIAALWGVGFLYRSHIYRNYEEVLEIVENIETYVKKSLPRQHLHERQSFGLIGLTLYLKGKLLSATGEYSSAEKAYAQSSDAYVMRLDQKNEFSEKGYITKEQYEEKKIVTLRRTALVSALGLGYLAFISSRIYKALAALRMARAALKQNVGAVYEAYTDILFFACRRAEGSSERETIEEVVKGIQACYETLLNLVPETHYLHRAGIELAIALHYRIKSAQKSGAGTEHASADYDKAMELLKLAIEYAEGVEGERKKNQRLLTEALFIRSYIRRCLPEIAENRHSNLSKAEDDARRSLKEAAGNKRMVCEALIALGSAQYEQARYYKSINKEIEFRKKVNAAQNSFHDALTGNDRKNVRIEAVCYLKLAKLNLCDPDRVALAHDYYFKKWKEIENRVEHAFCHYMADEIGKRLSEGGPLLIINAESPLSYSEWQDKLLTHLFNTMLIKLSEETKKEQSDEKQLHSLIIKRLMGSLKFTKHKAYKLTDKHGLVEKLQQLNK